MARLREDRVAERLRDVPLEEPLPVLREYGRIPDGIVQGEPHEPAEQEVVVELRHQLPLAPDAGAGVEQERAQELLRRDRGAASVGVEQREAGRQILQGLIHHGPDRAERVVLGHALLGLNVAPHAALFLASDESSWITGVDIGVDGGFLHGKRI